MAFDFGPDHPGAPPPDQPDWGYNIPIIILILALMVCFLCMAAKGGIP